MKQKELRTDSFQSSFYIGQISTDDEMSGEFDKIARYTELPLEVAVRSSYPLLLFALISKTESFITSTEPRADSGIEKSLPL